MKQEDADRIKWAIQTGYHNRKDYPPYALAPWDDRNRYTEWVFKIIQEQVTPPSRLRRWVVVKLNRIEYTVSGWLGVPRPDLIPDEEGK